MTDDNLDELGLGDDNSNPTGENQNKSDKQGATLDQEIQTRDAQIAHWRGKAVDKDTGKTYKELYESSKNPTSKEKPAQPKDEAKAWDTPSDPLEVVRLGKALQGYNEEETEFIIRNAKTKNIDGLILASKDEMVQLAIQTKRDKVAKENKIPSPSSPGGGFSQKSPKEISEMNRDEHMAYEKEMVEQQKSQGI